MSPSRDLARKMESQEKSATKRRLKKKIVEKKVRSPTKRLMQMKNAHVRNAKKAAKRNDTYGKELYTVSPTHSYLVKKEYNPHMDENDMTQVEKDIADRVEDYMRSKEYVGNGTDPRISVIQTHETYEEVHGAPVRVLHTESSPSKASNGGLQAQVLADMQLEAQRISEQLTGGKAPHASDSL